MALFTDFTDFTDQALDGTQRRIRSQLEMETVKMAFTDRNAARKMFETNQRGFTVEIAVKMLAAIVSSGGDEAVDQAGANYMVKTAFMLAETFIAERDRRYGE